MKFAEIIDPYLKKYPRIFTDIENARLHLIGSGVAWHKSCYVPMAAVSTVMGLNPQSPFDALMALANITAFASWRMGGKHIIKFDKTVEAELIDGGIKGDVPMHIFERLPFMCAYVEVSNDPAIVGFFVHLEHDILTNDLELRFVLEDAKGGVAPTVIDLNTNGTIEEVVAKTMRSVDVLGRNKSNTVVTEISSLMHRVLPLVMYLCSANAETSDKTKPNLPTLPRNKRVMSPNAPTTWVYGERIGAMIRSGVSHQPTQATGTGTSKRPHIRRAHWHIYRVGSGRTGTMLKWMHPLAINADDGSDMPVTTRKV